MISDGSGTFGTSKNTIIGEGEAKPQRQDNRVKQIRIIEMRETNNKETETEPEMRYLALLGPLGRGRPLGNELWRLQLQR